MTEPRKKPCCDRGDRYIKYDVQEDFFYLEHVENEYLDIEFCPWCGAKCETEAES